MHTRPIDNAVAGFVSGDAEHVNGIARLLTPQRIGVVHLVAQGQERVMAVEMPGLRRQIYRFDRIAAKQMNDIGGLGHPDEILEIVIVTVAASSLKITAKGALAILRS